MEFYNVTDSTGHQICRWSSFFSTCACVYKPGEDGFLSLLQLNIPCNRKSLVQKHAFITYPNSKSWFSLAVELYLVKIFILNESAIWLVSKKSHNMEIHCQFHTEEHADLVVSQ